MIEVIKKITNTNYYKSKNWNKEEAVRYVLQIDESIIEASFFIHYLNDIYVKSVIELPTSFGCPVKCAHCASSLIKKFNRITISELLGIVDLIVTDQKIALDESFLVTYSGIGEGAYVRESVFEASSILFKKYSNSYFTFTTVGIDISFVNAFSQQQFSFPLHYLQISYLHWNKEKLLDLVPTAKNYSFDNLVNSIKLIRHVKVRMNFVVISGFNDSIYHAKVLADSLNDVKNNIVFRISKLNETEAGKRNGLKSPNDKTLVNIYNYFSDAGFSAYVFSSKQNDNLNCGQLVWKY